MFIVGGYFTGFSKEKLEDERITSIRVFSLILSVMVYFILLIIGIIFTYETDFLRVLIYNMFTMLITYLIVYHILLYRHYKEKY